MKTLVIVLGVMIVAAAGLLVYGIVNKLGNLAGEDRDAARSFGEYAVDLPPGAEVKSFVVEENRLVVHLSLPNGQARFLVLDLETGRQLGAIMLERKAGE